MVVAEKHRTVWRRTAASLIDFAILVPLMFLQYRIGRTLVDKTAIGAVLVLQPVIVLTYQALLHWKFGGTVGKLLMGLRVVDLSEKRLTFGQAVRREALNIALAAGSLVPELSRVAAGVQPFSSLAVETSARGADSSILSWVYGWVFLLELATMLTNAKRRSVHDFIAGSVVIKIGAQRAASPQQAPSRALR